MSNILFGCVVYMFIVIISSSSSLSFGKLLNVFSSKIDEIDKSL